MVAVGKLAAIARMARENEVPVHMDGAPIFNAAVALGLPAARSPVTPTG